MDIKKLQALVIDALEDVKAQDIRVYDTTHLTSMFDSIAVASGTSNRQTKALAASVRDKVKAAGGEIVSIEGENTGEWVLVDLGDMVVHIMQPAIRAYYRLEELWGDREVRPTKQAAKKVAKKSATKASTPSHGTAAATTRKATTKPTAKTAKKTPASPRPAAKTTAKPPAKTTAKSAAKTAAKTKAKTPAKSTTSLQAKTAAKSPAKKAAPRRAAAKG
ncbi:MAG: ribosome silencing factor [Betaproteobacteria bacterium]|nr:ribosome silencing factor [Betaproteobacteria bacterium]